MEKLSAAVRLGGETAGVEELGRAGGAEEGADVLAPPPLFREGADWGLEAT